MKRKKRFILAVICISRIAAAEPLSSSRYADLADYYIAAMARLSKRDARQNGAVGAPESEYYAENAFFDDIGPIVRVKWGLTIEVRKDTGRLLSIRDERLSDRLAKEAAQIKPVLSIEQAVGRAREYLHDLGVPLPQHYQVVEAVFHGNHKFFQSRWEIIWMPFEDEVAYHDGDPASPFIKIEFHERYGFIAFLSPYEWPRPKGMTINISRVKAADSAFRKAPAVLDTAFFRERRPAGYVISGVSGIELRVMAPNGLLSGDVIRSSLPKETRLCWVVELIANQPRSEKWTLLRIWMWVDAATGEVIGGDFR